MFYFTKEICSERSTIGCHKVNSCDFFNCEEGCKTTIESKSLLCKWFSKEKICSKCIAKPGEYCYSAKKVLNCPSGFYCPGNIESPIQCPIGTISYNGAKTINECFYITDNGNIVYNISSTLSPTTTITKNPSKIPTKNPTLNPQEPVIIKTSAPSSMPTLSPSNSPTRNPSLNPSKNPTRNPTKNPSSSPSNKPIRRPSRGPTRNPGRILIKKPSSSPTESPSNQPTVVIAIFNATTDR